jgi:lipoprotein-anchoring transpeptidase ErfK/SrfK
MQALDSFSRRDFLQIGWFGLLGFFTPRLKRPYQRLSNIQGRVIYNLVKVYDRPSLNGQVIKQYWIDSVIPITEVTIGDSDPEYNRVWYKISDKGYAHSGGIQPVRTVVNQPTSDIQRGGQLAEITVPYTDARWDAGPEEKVAYRFYYETTHWVIGLTYALDGSPWYRILDDKWELVLYVPAQHVRIIPESELNILSPHVPPEAKRVEVRTNDQVVIAYEWDRPVFMARTATGAEFSNGKFYTPLGRHKTFHKRPSRHMAAGNLARNGYDLPGIPWVSYITESGIAFHGTYWHNDYGLPRSHGCINLTSQAAKWLFRWTLPSVLPYEQLAYDEFATHVDII